MVAQEVGEDERLRASLRVADVDDLREDLELAVMELQEMGVATSSIRRYVNSALRAPTKNGVRGTTFLFKRWKRER